MITLTQYIQTSIGKKQVVAITGLMLVVYVIGHLAGNLLLYLGPQAFNGYAHKLEGLRPGLYVIEVALLLVFVIHIYFTALVIWENIQSRPKRYKVYGESGPRSWATRLRMYTGVYILLFVVWHICDFTLIDKHGPRSMINGQSLGLYGVVFNSFSDPLHSILYIMAMMCLGLHLSHGIQSFAQTFGWEGPKIKGFSDAAALMIAFGYSSIPIYVYFVTHSIK